MSSDLCPHCFMKVKLDSDFMYDNNMYENDNEGSFKCDYCENIIYWKCSLVPEITLETDPEFL